MRVPRELQPDDMIACLHSISLLVKDPTHMDTRPNAQWTRLVCTTKTLQPLQCCSKWLSQASARSLLVPVPVGSIQALKSVQALTAHGQMLVLAGDKVRSVRCLHPVRERLSV